MVLTALKGLTDIFNCTGHHVCHENLFSICLISIQTNVFSILSAYCEVVQDPTKWTFTKLKANSITSLLRL